MATVIKVEESYALAAEEDRCAIRTRVNIPAMLRKQGETAFQVQVIDLSVAGFACRAVTSAKPGSITWLTLPGLAGIQAEIIWNDGQIVGCAFSTLLHQCVLDRLLSRYAERSLASVI